LLETLWDLVRHGELDAAIRVCEQGGEPWRGASLMGGRRWTMGGLSELGHIGHIVDRIAASRIHIQADC
jgi:hypothetical protein